MLWQQGVKRVPGTAVTKSVVAPEPTGKKREEIFVDVIEKISVTFSSSVRLFVFAIQEYAPLVLIHLFWPVLHSSSVHFSFLGKHSYIRGGWNYSNEKLLVWQSRDKACPE